MTDNKLTDEEIIKDLTELSLYTGFQERYIQVLNATLDLINSQKSEIERLKGSTIVNNIMEIHRIKRGAKAEASKEFAERLKLHSYIMSDESQTGIINRHSVVTVNQIDNLLKEMVGGENDIRTST